ncbi:MAG TPA: hypothetical protein PLP21_03555 [Pyrinomonadaceae bacterium]|nr:hypothetical protein [Acidobacteriota bacterium]HQZ95365.1 hypothetical protein [Pyrinomonadaceae bacterium]
MYRRPKFLEVLLEIRREMALESDYDVDLFAETARSGTRSTRIAHFQVEQSDDRSSDNNETVELRSSRGA